MLHILVVCCIALASVHLADGLAVAKPTEAMHDSDHEDVDVLQHMLSLSPNAEEDGTGVLLAAQTPTDGQPEPPVRPYPKSRFTGPEFAPDPEALQLAIGPTLSVERLQAPDNSIPRHNAETHSHSASSDLAEIEVQEKQKDAQQKGANPLKGASAMPVDDVDDIISQEMPKAAVSAGKAASLDVLAVTTEETPETMRKLVFDAAMKAGYCKAVPCTQQELTSWAQDTAALASAARLIVSEPGSASAATTSASPTARTLASSASVLSLAAPRLIKRDDIGIKYAVAIKDDDVDVLQHMLSLSPIADEQSSGTPIVDDQSRGPQRQNQRTTPQASTDAPRSLREGAITEWAHARIDDIQTIASTWVGVQKEGEQNELFLIIGIVSGAVIFGVLGVLIGMVTHRVYRLRKKRQRDMAKAMDQSNHVLQPPAAPLKKGPSKGDL